MQRCLLALLLLFVGGCPSVYVPGHLTRSPSTGGPSPNAFTFGCVDVLVSPERWAETPQGGQIFAIAVGNRCSHGVPTFFSALRVRFWQEASPDAIATRAFDPRHEIRPAVLGPEELVAERILFVAEGGLYLAPPRRVCIDLDGLTADAHGDTQRCFASDGTGWRMFQ